MKRSILLLACGLAVALTATFALAAGVGLAAGWVGAGSAAVARCDTDGFTTALVTTGSPAVVSSITVGDIADPGCERGVLSVRLVNSTGDAIAAGGPQAVPVDADSAPNSMTVAVSPAPAETQVAGARIVVLGP